MNLDDLKRRAIELERRVIELETELKLLKSELARVRVAGHDNAIDIGVLYRKTEILERASRRPTERAEPEEPFSRNVLGVQLTPNDRPRKP